MYFQILKKDLKRKKTMNIILLIFIILAATFIASSVNNMNTVITALDTYFDKAQVPDHWFVVNDKKEAEQFADFAKSHHYRYWNQEVLQLNPNDIMVNNQKFEYSNTIIISSIKNSTKVFDINNNEITNINDGEIYLPAELFYSDKYDFEEGKTIKITLHGKTKEFSLTKSVKDALFGSPMVGIARFLISERDYQYFCNEQKDNMFSIGVYTSDKDYMESFNNLELNLIFNVNKNGIKTMYMMDMVIAAIMLIVSTCLILISIVILRFTIHFTMSEEFREIGVMKAIGIPCHKIRELYIIKYFAISIIGGIIGFLLSIPFHKIMLINLSRNIIISNSKTLFLNMICAVFVVITVVIFCYFCTRKVKKFSPIDAIRNGETGERYTKKGILHLNKSRLFPVPFMAVNDILSETKKFIIMFIIFTLGILLIIIPVNTINTLQSDHLITLFNMAECDLIISDKELFFSSNNDNQKLISDSLDNINNVLTRHHIKADVFEEILFRMSISHSNQKMSSLAFQGIGDITTEEYIYLEGSAPQNHNEIAISHIVRDRIDADIGDNVEIKNGDVTKKYIVTAIFQCMNNMGEGIRFYQDETLDYKYAAGSFSTQIRYQDHPDKKEKNRRKELLKKCFPNGKIYTPGEYINNTIGDIAGKVQSIKQFIVIIVLCINILVTVLMLKSFLTKEKNEIAILKAIGFKNSSLIAWQAFRIGILLFLSVLAGTLLSTPLSEISAGQAFKIMGAQKITFDIVPFEVYILYPLIVLLVTVLAGILTAMQIKKISTSEVSNID